MERIEQLENEFNVAYFKVVLLDGSVLEVHVGSHVTTISSGGEEQFVEAWRMRELVVRRFLSGDSCAEVAPITEEEGKCLKTATVCFEHLNSFVRKLATIFQFSKFWSYFLSDHGPKTTRSRYQK